MGSDLIKDSQVILSEASPVAKMYPPGCDWDQGPLVTEDGKTIVCISVEAPISLLIYAGPSSTKIVPWCLAWLEYSTSTPRAAPHVLYETTIDALVNSSFRLGELWTNASRSRVIGYRSASDSRIVKPAFSGLVSRGTLHPLPAPSTVIPASPTVIAW